MLQDMTCDACDPWTFSHPWCNAPCCEEKLLTNISTTTIFPHQPLLPQTSPARMSQSTITPTGLDSSGGSDIWVDGDDAVVTPPTMSPPNHYLYPPSSRALR